MKTRMKTTLPASAIDSQNNTQQRYEIVDYAQNKIIHIQFNFIILNYS